MRTSTDIIALLELRSEQLRIHLRAVPKESAEARQAKCDLALMKAKSAALKLFGQETDTTGKILH
jgi:hypothetical protein